MYQLDSVPRHSTNAIQQWLQEHGEEDVSWPPNSSKSKRAFLGCDWTMDGREAPFKGDQSVQYQCLNTTNYTIRDHVHAVLWEGPIQYLPGSFNIVAHCYTAYTP